MPKKTFSALLIFTTVFDTLNRRRIQSFYGNHMGSFHIGFETSGSEY